MPTKVHLVKATDFPVVMYGCESWTIKKAECWRIDAFELWCWRRLLRVPWTARRSNQSILKKSVLNILWKDWCWSLNTLATWYKEPTHWKRLMLGKIEGWRRRGNRWWDGWMASLIQWTWVYQVLGDGEGQGSLACCSLWGCKELDTSKRLNNSNLWIAFIRGRDQGNHISHGKLLISFFCWPIALANQNASPWTGQAVSQPLLELFTLPGKHSLVPAKDLSPRYFPLRNCSRFITILLPCLRSDHFLQWHFPTHSPSITVLISLSHLLPYMLLCLTRL